MPKFIVSLERTCTIEETASFEIEAASQSEARKTAKAKMLDDQFAEGLDWEACDTDYGRVRIDGIDPA